MKFTEEQVISEISSIFSPSNQKNPRVLVGIGDDAAVVATDKHSVITTDMAIEDVHFKCEWSTAYQIGSKITVANLADVYAMGADPQYLVVALTLTGDEEMQWINDLAQGIADTAAASDSVVVGGDLSRGEKIMISVTAVGSSRLHITRSGARPGIRFIFLHCQAGRVQDMKFSLDIFQFRQRMHVHCLNLDLQNLTQQSCAASRALTRYVTLVIP